jgi:hypothetical protein
MKKKECRFCGAELNITFVNLGMHPLSNSFLTAPQTDEMLPFYPLHAYVCEKCFLVQLETFETAENIFSDYLYTSSHSESWLKHAEQYADKMTAFAGLNKNSQVIEIASNDGYLLQYFIQNNIPSLGIEPAANIAKIAVDKGVLTLVEFFGVECATRLAKKGTKADLMTANNVFAHVPNINDFTQGLKIALKHTGILTIEFPHLLQLIRGNQFDTIYHEHFSYLSLMTSEKILAHHGLTVFDVEELPTHGGSLRLYIRHSENSSRPVQARVSQVREREIEAGIDQLKIYDEFNKKVKKTKRELLSFLIAEKNKGKTIVAYGAAAKGNTLLTYCGIRTDFIDYVVDRSPLKQKRFLPGSQIPIEHPDKIAETQPDYVLILPWNIKNEIMEQMSHVRNWGGRFIVAIPEVSVL